MRTYHHTETKLVGYSKVLKEAKAQAHKYFDMIWKLGYMKRDETYLFMAKWLNRKEPRVHMSQANLRDCHLITRESINYLNTMRRLKLDIGEPIYHPYFWLLEEKENPHNISKLIKQQFK